MPSFPSARTRWAAITILSSVTLTSAASAQSPDFAELQRNPAVRVAVTSCMADRGRLCGGVMPGGGRIVHCLVEQSAALSPGCRAALDRASSALVAAGVALMPERPVK
jgi:hypothetical protein